MRNPINKQELNTFNYFSDIITNSNRPKLISKFKDINVKLSKLITLLNSNNDKSKIDLILNEIQQEYNKYVSNIESNNKKEDILLDTIDQFLFNCKSIILTNYKILLEKESVFSDSEDDKKFINSNTHPIKELLDSLQYNVVKVTSQNTKKYFIYKLDPISNYTELTITTKGDCVDEIIHIFNKKLGVDWFSHLNIFEGKSFKIGEQKLREFVSYHCDRINDLQTDPSQGITFFEDNKLYFNMFQNTYYLNEKIKKELIEKDWSVIKTVLLNLVNNNEDYYNWVINWLAVLYQYPAYRFTTSILFNGVKGSGKGMLTKTLTELFGNCSYSANSRDLTSNFNAQLFEGKFLLLANEIMDQNKKYTFSNDLKEFVTESKISVEKKFCDRYMAKNFMKLILFSNSPKPINIEEGDRRYGVFYSTKKIEKVIDYNLRNKYFEDKEFFINQVEGFAYFLNNYKIDLEKVVSEPIMTPEKQAVIDINQTDFKSIIDEILLNLINDWTPNKKGVYWINTSKIYDEYDILVSGELNRYKKIKFIYKNKFGGRLKTEGYRTEFNSIETVKATFLRIPDKMVKEYKEDDYKSYYLKEE